MKTIILLLIALALPLFSADKSPLVTHLEAGEKLTIVTYGTSLTAGGAWVKQLAEVLEQQYPEQAKIINSGGSGKWSDWGVANLQKRVIDKKPDVVFMEFSMNDCVERFQGSVAIAKKNLETMIDGILQSNKKCKIILMTMTPGDAYPVGHTSYRKDIVKHYDMYREVANERKLLLIDHYPSWKKLQTEEPEKFKLFVPDTIHVTPKGCAEIVTPSIVSALGLSPKAK